MEHDYNNQEYLQHYGVPGMKWGIRKNARLLANHRRNAEVRKIKKDYKTGEISRKEKKTRISEANEAKKTAIKSNMREIRQTKGSQNIKQLKTDIKNQTIKEVPHRTLKKGANFINKAVGIANIGAGLGTGAAAALISPPLAGVVLGSAAIRTAAIAGGQYLIQRKILDKLA